MSIYAMLWRLHFPRDGDDHTACECVLRAVVMARGGTPKERDGSSRMRSPEE